MRQVSEPTECGSSPTLEVWVWLYLQLKAKYLASTVLFIQPIHSRPKGIHAAPVYHYSFEYHYFIIIHLNIIIL